MLLLTNIAPTTWTMEQLKPFFQRADHDKYVAWCRYTCSNVFMRAADPCVHRKQTCDASKQAGRHKDRQVARQTGRQAGA